MSWDEYTETKIIEGIGNATIITKTDDWNRSKHSVSLDSDNYHIESRYVRKYLDSWESFYAVPNGKTINHSLDVPNVQFNSFQEELCHKYSKNMLEEFLRLLKENRAKFEFPIRRGNKLESVTNDYYSNFKKIDRLNCTEKVLEAIAMYDNYKYNYSKFYDMKTKAEKKKNDLDSKVLDLSTKIF